MPAELRAVSDAAAASDGDTFIVTDGTASIPEYRARGPPRVFIGNLARCHGRRSRRSASGVQSGLHTPPTGVFVFERRALAAVPPRGFYDIKEHLVPRLRAAGEARWSCLRVGDRHRACSARRPISPSTSGSSSAWSPHVQRPTAWRHLVSRGMPHRIHPHRRKPCALRSVGRTRCHHHRTVLIAAGARGTKWRGPRGAEFRRSQLRRGKGRWFHVRRCGAVPSWAPTPSPIAHRRCRRCRAAADSRAFPDRGARSQQHSSAAVMRPAGIDGRLSSVVLGCHRHRSTHGCEPDTRHENLAPRHRLATASTERRTPSLRASAWHSHRLRTRSRRDCEGHAECPVDRRADRRGLTIHRSDSRALSCACRPFRDASFSSGCPPTKSPTCCSSSIHAACLCRSTNCRR